MKIISLFCDYDDSYRLGWYKYYNFSAISKKMNMAKIIFIIILLFVSLTINSQCSANINFIKKILILYTNEIKYEQIQYLKKYDLLILNRFNYNDINGFLWDTLRGNNINCKIFVYQLGPETNNNQDEYKIHYLNSISRFVVSRRHSMGSLKNNNEDLFLRDASGQMITNLSYPNSLLMRFGSQRYQQFWLEATQNDILAQSWKADGVFVDNCLVAVNVTGNNPLGSKYPVDSSYKDATAWNDSMVGFVNAVTAGLHAKRQQVVVNRGNSRFQEGYNAWIALDQSPAPPDFVMEEGAFAVSYGSSSDVQFYREEEWKRQVDVVREINHSEVILHSHTDLSPENLTGKDNFGRPVTFWQVLWYSMCSYHLARKDNPNNSYFMFGTRGYKTILWYDEYDKINLGKAIGPYIKQVVYGTAVYMREFENGYVLVNPTGADAQSFPLPQYCVQRTHDNLNSDFSKLPVVSTVEIPSHHGVICFKKANSPRNLFINKIESKPFADGNLEIAP